MMENTYPWRHLSIPDVLQLGNSIHWPSRCIRSRRNFFSFVSHLDDEILRCLKNKAIHLIDSRKQYEQRLQEEYELERLHRKHNQMEIQRNERVTKMETVPSTEDFLKDVGSETRKNIIKKFITATSTNRVCQQICCSCGGLFERFDMEKRNLQTLPNKELLKPNEPHAAHVFIEDMLLEKKGTIDEDHVVYGYFCYACWNDLNHLKLPKFSLANNTWIGDIPFKLLILTVPERILILIFYPAVHVYKLYPKLIQGKWFNMLNEKLRGNVSTYRLHPQRMVDALSGSMLPQKPEVLASLISVTMVGKKRCEESTLRGLLQVRRWRMLDAVVWLKQNNPFYYNISIDEDALNQFPEEGIPQSILANIKFIDEESSVNNINEEFIQDDDDTLPNLNNSDFEAEITTYDSFNEAPSDGYVDENNSDNNDGDDGNVVLNKRIFILLISLN